MRTASLAACAVALLMAGCANITKRDDVQVYDAAAKVNGVKIRVETDFDGNPLRVSARLPADVEWVPAVHPVEDGYIITVTRRDVVTDLE